MKGVMIPGVSAGSNQVGARDTCTPQVSCPSGRAAPARRGEPAANAKAASAKTSRRVTCGLESPLSGIRQLLRVLIGFLRLGGLVIGPCRAPRGAAGPSDLLVQVPLIVMS